MTIIATNLIAGVEGGANVEDGTKEFSETYRVLSDSSYENQVSVLLGANIPFPFQPHSVWPFALAYDFRSRQDPKARQVWYVDVKYKTFKDDDEEDEDPLNKPPKISRSNETVELPVFRDANNQPYVNSLAEPLLNPPMTISWSRAVYTVTQNIAYFDADLHDTYENAINSDVFTLHRPGFHKTFSEGTAWIKSVSASSQKQNDTYYWERVWTVVHERRGWNAVKNPPDYSYNFYNAGEGRIERVLQGDGTEVPHPVLLDSSQQPLTPDYQSPGWTFDPDTDPVYLNFSNFIELPFAALQYV